MITYTHAGSKLIQNDENSSKEKGTHLWELGLASAKAI